MQRFLGLFGAASSLVLFFAACGGKVVVDASSDGSGGNGGAGGESTTTVYDGPFVAVGPSAVSSGVTTGSGMGCSTCSQALTDPDVDPSTLCSGNAEALFEELLKCVCDGICAGVCDNNVCMGLPTSDMCNACLKDTSTGCGFELNNCLAN